MPIYEYECGSCGGRVERLVRNAADVPKSCPSCGSRKISKLLSAFSVGAAPAHAHEHSPSAACSSCSSSGSCPYGG